MLDTDNRINFGEALRPIEGYEMDYALGTTYSLSLESLMFIPVTLLRGKDLCTQEKVMTSEMVEALMKVPDKVKVFCQRGKIQKPPFYHEILAFWENSIEQIHLDTEYQSFHPKLWLLRYRGLKKGLLPKYKFICTSRNLTLSKDWDLAVCLEGTVTRKTYSANQPLLDFISMLDRNAVRKIRPELISEILHINFELTDEQDNYSFHPIGFDNYKHPLLEETVFNEKLMVISPFLQQKTIEAHKKRCEKFSLYSNDIELNSIPESVFENVHVYQFNPTITNAAIAYNELESDEDREIYDPGCFLHAKCYITENANTASWYIGSANCSDPARERNIEFLTRITFQPKKNCIAEAHKNLTAPIKGGQQGLFIKYIPHAIEIDNEHTNDETTLRRTIFQISGLEFSGKIIEKENIGFDLHLQIISGSLSLEEGWSVRILSLSAFQEKEQQIQNHITDQTFVFKDFEETKLTPFLICKIYKDQVCMKQLVLKIEMEFPNDRMNKIFKSIICDRNRLFQYLNSLLSKEDGTPLFDLHQEKKSGYSFGYSAEVEPIALYEKLLRASSRDRGKIKLVAETLEKLANEKDEQGNPIVEEDLANFFKVFQKYSEDEV